MTVQSSASTSVGGLYVVGYNSNPDAELLGGLGSVQQNTSLPGATSANAWRTVTVAGRLEDRGAWYTLDPDSNEIMKTTQGYFAIVAQIPSTGTEPTQYAVWLDYEIELSGPAVNPVPQVLGLFPAGRWTRVANQSYATFVASSGEPPFPTLAEGKNYSVNPAWTLEDYQGDEVMAVAIRHRAVGVSFYSSVENATSDTRIGIEDSFDTPRTVIASLP